MLRRCFSPWSGRGVMPHSTSRSTRAAVGSPKKRSGVVKAAHVVEHDDDRQPRRGRRSTNYWRGSAKTTIAGRLFLVMAGSIAPGPAPLRGLLPNSHCPRASALTSVRRNAAARRAKPTDTYRATYGQTYFNVRCPAGRRHVRPVLFFASPDRCERAVTRRLPPHEQRGSVLRHEARPHAANAGHEPSGRRRAGEHRGSELRDGRGRRHGRAPGRRNRQPHGDLGADQPRARRPRLDFQSGRRPCARARTESPPAHSGSRRDAHRARPARAGAAGHGDDADRRTKPRPRSPDHPCRRFARLPAPRRRTAPPHTGPHLRAAAR